MVQKIRKTIVKKDKKQFISGVVHIQSTFNNTIITISNLTGDTISAASGCRKRQESDSSLPWTQTNKFCSCTQRVFTTKAGRWQLLLQFQVSSKTCRYSEEACGGTKRVPRNEPRSPRRVERKV